MEKDSTLNQEKAMSMQTMLEDAKDKFWDYLPKLAIAIVVLILGFLAIKFITRAFVKLLERRKVDTTLHPFLRGLCSITLKLALLLAVGEYMGIKTTSFLALLGAAGLAIGLALQGSLSNFAGGVLLLIFRPYRKGDLVEAQDCLGVVEEIQVFNTILISPQNQRIILPNAAVSNGTIKNYTKEGKLRLDLVIGIGYGEDIKKAREVLVTTMKANKDILQDPEPSVIVKELADSSVNLLLLPYATPENYWKAYSSILEDCKEALDAAGIEIPYPHQVSYEYKLEKK